MSNQANKLVADMLRCIVTDLDAGNSNVSDDAAMKIAECIAEYSYRKGETKNLTETCEYLGITRQTLSNWVDSGKMKPGKKRRGSGLFWSVKYLEKFRDSLRK